MIHRLIVLLVLVGQLVGRAGEVAPPGQATINAADYKTADSPTAGIQEAIDKLPATGGTVLIPAGIYPISRSINLRANIRLIGDGDITSICRADPCVEAQLLQPGKKGDTRITIADSKGFRVGHEVAVKSGPREGWKTTHALIVAIEGNTLSLSSPLTNDYPLDQDAYVTNYFPTLYANAAGSLVIQSLQIDGRLARGMQVRSDFTVAAIHLVRCPDSLVSRVTVKNYPADGIGVQGGTNISVSQCISENNFGHGFHPGTDITGGSWTSNVARFNVNDGFFFCQGVKNLYVAGNQFYDNGGHGIGNLGTPDDSDKDNIVNGNHCFNNGLCGIECRDGGNNIISGNICENNSKSAPNRWPGILIQNTHDSIFIGNRCMDSQASEHQTQADGVLVQRNSHDNMIANNIVSGRDGRGISGNSLAGNTIKDNVTTPGKPAQ